MKKEPKRRDRGRQSINGISAPLRFETLTLGFCRNLPRLGVGAMSNEHATMRLSAFRHVNAKNWCKCWKQAAACGFRQRGCWAMAPARSHSTMHPIAANRTPNCLDSFLGQFAPSVAKCPVVQKQCLRATSAAKRLRAGSHGHQTRLVFVGGVVRTLSSQQVDSPGRGILPRDARLLPWGCGFLTRCNCLGTLGLPLAWFPHDECQTR